MKKLALLISLSLLSSCATMSTKECQSANWRDVGFKDATKGRSVKLSGHSKACSKVKVTPNRSQYMSGYNAGARQYCTYESGLKRGKRGRSASNICTSPSLGKAFSKGYAKGKQVYRINKKIDKKESEIKKIEKKLSDIRKKKVKASAYRVDLLHREKALINREIDSLQRERRRL